LVQIVVFLYFFSALIVIKNLMAKIAYFII